MNLMNQQSTPSRNRVTYALGRRLRVVRTELGISQHDLSELSHIDATSISRIERGIGNPTLDLITRLAVALDTTVADLVVDITAEDLGEKVIRRPTARDFLEYRRRYGTDS